MELRLRLFEFVGRWWLLETSDEEAPLVTDVPPGSTVSKTDVGLISAMDVLLCGDRFAEFVDSSIWWSRMHHWTRRGWLNMPEVT